jgi:hypothetical protein
MSGTCVRLTKTFAGNPAPDEVRLQFLEASGALDGYSGEFGIGCKCTGLLVHPDDPNTYEAAPRAVGPRRRGSNPRAAGALEGAPGAHGQGQGQLLAEWPSENLFPGRTVVLVRARGSMVELELRDTWNPLGYEGDVRPLDVALYEAEVAPFLTWANETDDGYPLFIDLDGEPIGPDFVGRKWLAIAYYARPVD